MNLTILRGTLSSPPVLRTLPSGDEITVLQVTTEPWGAHPKSSVPVCVTGAGAAARWEAGDRVVGVGSVRRRFFRTGGVTASATEIQAAQVIAASAAKRVERALAAAALEFSSAAMSS